MDERLQFVARRLAPALRIHDRTSVNHEDLPNTKV
jgi:hypothetical protein